MTDHADPTIDQAAAAALGQRLVATIEECARLIPEALDNGDERSAWSLGAMRKEARQDLVELRHLRGRA